MSALIRPRQRAITTISPHNANRRFIVPKRGRRGGVITPQERPWDGFTTHAALDEFVSHFVTEHGLVLPPEWGGWTLAQKRQWLNDNVDPTPEDQS